MSDTVIKAENLSKSYLLGHRQKRRERYVTLRDVIMREARQFARKGIDLVRGRQIVQGDDVEELWALKDVSFEVKQGEVLGIIGRNGAGKSTLLKILSRITEPTKGRILLRGRVSSLLEVGTGFHPELTGRENIFLNGAILGMSQREIRKKFDEIVAFAEVEKFLDLPVKHYSSGMYVRLAFAVAAHLEPEILIVDEVLAVGDVEFQKKCLGKMKNVVTDGRTILFVTHNFGALLELTSRAILLSRGVVDFIGAPSDAVAKYTSRSYSLQTWEFDVRNVPRRWGGTGDVKLLSLRFARPLPYFNFLEPIRYTVRVKAAHSVERLRIGMTVSTSNGIVVGNGFSPDIAGIKAGEERDFFVELASVRLAPGNYFCAVSVGRGNHRTSYVDYDIVTDTLFFEVGPEKTPSGEIAPWYWGSISFPDLIIEPMEEQR